MLNPVGNSDIHRGSFTKKERKCYTDAVVCLQKLPSQLDPAEVPSAVNLTRYDGLYSNVRNFLRALTNCKKDFLAVHINQTQVIHMSGYFLPVSSLNPPSTLMKEVH